MSSQSIHAQKDLFRLIELFPPRLRVLTVLYGSGRVNTWSHLPTDPTALCSSHGKRTKHSMVCFALGAVRAESSGLGRNNPFFLPRSSHKSSDPVSLIPTHLETVYVTTDDSENFTCQGSLVTSSWPPHLPGVAASPGIEQRPLLAFKHRLRTIWFLT